MARPIADAWKLPPAELVARLGSGDDGLTSAEAAARLTRLGPNELGRRERPGLLRLLTRQVTNPLTVILLVAAVVSGLAGEWTDVAIILVIVGLSSATAAWREFDSGRALERLSARIATRARVVRDGAEQRVEVAAVVPGDVLVLAAGSIIPADAVLLEARDLHTSEAVLTGESFPVEKRPGALPDAATLGERLNFLYFGTQVRSGTARAVAVATAQDTEYGQIAERLRVRPPETEFDRGLRRFGGLLVRVMLTMTLVVLALNLLIEKPPIESLLFAAALAVGLSPELLPAILTYNLTRSAAAMAEAGVLVRRLPAIENFGSMDILCTDKTGTLTEGTMRLHAAIDEREAPSERVRRLACWNAALQTGIANPLDDALVEALAGEPTPRKLDEVPYDFVRKRLSVVVEPDGEPLLVSKGAVPQVLAVCRDMSEARRAACDALVERASRDGFRVLAVATRVVPRRPMYSRDDERELELSGFLLFADPPKAEVAAAIAALRELGVQLKLITGDNLHVARHIAARVGLSAERTLTGAELATKGPEALWHLAESTDLFAEVDPDQKERIILALKKTGHVVGYMGDGINDVPAFHAADVGVSVESAVDVAREAADFVLLRRDLDMLRRGIIAGRTTFANTLKYVLTTTSANLGNMLSMAAASIALPFFPLLAGQILLNNFLSDVPAFGLATDAVDEEWLRRPRRWDMGQLERFMFSFGALSSAFDVLMFIALLFVFRAAAEQFRTAWFVESLLTELAVALVLRTRGPALRSRPGRVLLVSTGAVALVAVALPYTPAGALFGFVFLPPAMLAAVLAITAAYVVATEGFKRVFFAERRAARPAAG